jgi:hypothetical protein
LQVSQKREREIFVMCVVVVAIMEAQAVVFFQQNNELRMLQR